MQAARAAGEVARITASLVFGYRRHPAWDAEGCAACFAADDLAEFEVMIPGIESSAGAYADVIGAGGSHDDKAGPCAGIAGLEDFVDLRRRMDACLTGARLAKDRVADALTAVAIPDGARLPARGRRYVEYMSMIRAIARWQTRQNPTSSRVNMMQSASGR